MYKILKIFSTGLFLLFAACTAIPEDFNKQSSYAWPDPNATRLGQFFNQGNTDQNQLSGVYLLDNPGEALGYRLALASLAEKTLDIQYYLWKGDISGSLLLHRALQAADRGVKVRILLDDIYHSGRDVDYAAIAAHKNVQLRLFNPVGNRGIGRYLNFLINKRKLNNRMHNKIFLVDNAAAILGGRNIGDDYFGVDPNLNFRDLDVLTVGAVAKESGSAYDLYWNSQHAVPIQTIHKISTDTNALEQLREELDQGLNKVGALPYTIPIKFEEVETELTNLRNQLTWAKAEVLVDPLDRFSTNTESVFVKRGRETIDDIKDELVIETAYLIPDETGIKNFQQLTEQGVKVKVLTNSLMSNNHIAVHAHYMKHRKQLINTGVELYEFRADAEMREFLKQARITLASSHAGLHTKAAVADSKITMIGSFNFDPRSRNLNSEIGLLIFDEDFAARILEVMKPDFDPQNSYRVSMNNKQELRWHGELPSGPVEFTSDPNATLFRRIAAMLLRLLPIEDEL